MKRYIRCASAIYPSDFSEADQWDLEDLMRSYGLSDAEIKEAMSNKLDDLLNNPECPIHAYTCYVGYDVGDAESGPVVNEGKDFVFAKSPEDARKRLAAKYDDEDGYIGIRVAPASSKDLQDIVQLEAADRAYEFQDGNVYGSEDFIVDYDLSKLDDDYWAQAEKRRIDQELNDEYSGTTYTIYVKNKIYGNATSYEGMKNMMYDAWKHTHAELDDIVAYGPEGVQYDPYDLFDIEFVGGHRYIKEN